MKEKELDLGYLNFECFEGKHANAFNLPDKEVFNIVVYLFLLRHHTIIGSQYLCEYDYDYEYDVYAPYGIHSIHKLHQELENKGFYEPSKVTTVSLFYDTHTNSELRLIAKKVNIELEGHETTKDDFFKPFAISGKDAEIEKVLGYKYYSLSDKAQKWLPDHEDEYSLYVAYHNFLWKKRWDLMNYNFKNGNASFSPSPEIMSSLEIKQYTKKEEELIKKEIETDIVTYGREGYYQLGENYYYINPKEALKDYLMSLRLDGYGCYSIDKENASTRYLKITDLVWRIQNLSEYFSMDIIEEVFSKKLPLDTLDLDKVTFTNIVTKIIEGKFDNTALKEYKSMIQSKLDKTIQGECND